MAQFPMPVHLRWTWEGRLSSFSFLYMQVIAICGARDRLIYIQRSLSWLDNLLLYGKRALFEVCRTAHSFPSSSDDQSPALAAIVQHVRK